jgi:hypothetical protein
MLNTKYCLIDFRTSHGCWNLNADIICRFHAADRELLFTGSRYASLIDAALGQLRERHTVAIRSLNGFAGDWRIFHDDV